MMLYVNGDSHSAAADAAYPRNWACDDIRYHWMGRVPHPDNLAVSWGARLSQALGYDLHCHAQSGSSNDRIMRTTQEWITRWIEEYDHGEVVVILQWSTWERQEWLLDNQYYQIGASGHDSIPDQYVERYKRFVAEIDWQACTQYWHEKIWHFHQWLNELGIAHWFFNGDNDFSCLQQRYDWDGRYVDPYSPDGSFSGFMKKHRVDPVRPGHWHYGPQAHAIWSDRLYKFVKDKK